MDVWLNLCQKQINSRIKESQTLLIPCQQVGGDERNVLRQSVTQSVCLSVRQSVRPSIHL